MITETMIPMIIVPLTFLFVLLIILVVKAPKVGAWIIGGLVLLAPLLLYRCVMAGGFRHDEGVIIPLVVVPAAFLFVLVIILLNKAPKAGAGLIVALVMMGVCAALVLPGLSRRRAAVPASSVQMSQWKEVATEQGVEKVQVWEDTSTEHTWAVMSLAKVTPSPIWSEGVEKEFAADVYPSQQAAVRVLGSRVNKPVRELAGDANSLPQITLFQEDHDRALVVEFKNALQEALPQALCAIEAELRNIRPNEVGITLGLPGLDLQAAPWAKSPETKAASGHIEANVFNAGGRQVIGTQFVEKPWIENFAAFASGRPEQSFIVTRSQGTCTSESEAHQQALDDTRARLTEALGRRPEWQRGGLAEPTVTSTDVLQGGFIVDRFTQSFDGSAGKIWRQALLIDVSGPKLSQLAGQKARELHAQKMSWARMGFSVIGVLVLIGVIYFFLNAATMGYYEWSLRIAGVVLAIVAIISILMVVQ